MIDAKNGSGETALHIAARRQRGTAVASLIAQGAKVDLMDGEGRTPLHLCFLEAGDSSDSVAALLGAGASVDAVDDRGSTPLHGACSIGDARGTHALLMAGATSRANKNGDTPLHLAAAGGHVDCMHISIPYVTSAGDPYWYNPLTGESRWADALSIDHQGSRDATLLDDDDDDDEKKTEDDPVLSDDDDALLDEIVDQLVQEDDIAAQQQDYEAQRRQEDAETLLLEAAVTGED